MYSPGSPVCSPAASPRSPQYSGFAGSAWEESDSPVYSPRSPVYSPAASPRSPQYSGFVGREWEDSDDEWDLDLGWIPSKGWYRGEYQYCGDGVSVQDDDCVD